jgi:hypothetical protein
LATRKGNGYNNVGKRRIAKETIGNRRKQFQVY